MKTDLPIAPENGKEEQRGRRQQPKGQVGHNRSPGMPLPFPQHPQQIVQRAQRRPHRDRLHKAQRLCRNASTH